jgi:hypothetical protein
MSTGIIGTGRLRHCWFGEYAATIVVQWHTPALALQSLEAFPMFEIHAAEPRAIHFHGGGTDLKAAEAALKAHGADMRKVGSLARSIDFGEPFTVTIPLHGVETGPAPVQLGLEGL